MGMQKYDVIEAATQKWHATRSTHASAIKRAQTLANKLHIKMAVTYGDAIDHVWPDTEEKTMKRTALKNQIEQIIPALDEVGDRLRSEARKINEQKAQIASLKAQLENAENWLEKDRETLFSKIREHYTDSEIETADTWTTRTTA